MAQKKRWMTWVLDESAKATDPAPWARGTCPNWKKHLAVKAPALSLADLKSA